MFLLFQSKLIKKKDIYTFENTFVFSYREISRSLNISAFLFINTEINHDTELLSDDKPINTYFQF